MTQEQREMFTSYLTTLSERARSDVSQVAVEHFCDNEADANDCAALINDGIKRATCALMQSYRAEGSPLPTPGALTLVLDWSQAPVCIVRTTGVEVSAFDQVPETFAYLEGEGDRTYKSWREAHVLFFEREAQRLGLRFSNDTSLVMEHFEKVFP
ncbi:ASCH domain-containing protein [Salinicola halimionae]|uniref:ASCH domain-containing protein n=1 Tax=Salinicola halimionae TaxID=1949081 RepID=UPI000DA13CED|nr:ASCH domain-containing protein [Salinicola halimionae]